MINCANCGSGQIITRRDPKPIPVRYMDWETYCDECLDYDSLVSYGHTKEEAIENWNQENKDKVLT